MKANGSKSMSAHLTCNLAPSRGAGAGDDGPPQPQTATCCTALQRGFPADGKPTQSRFAPVRTPGSAAMMLHADDNGPIEEEEEPEEGEGQQQKQATTPTKRAETMIKKMVRKCKSSVADVDVARLGDGAPQTPRLRRSGAIRRDWSFEDLRGGNNAA
ncbi:hypothetical protein CFC21_010100 [Triticum aestivum]|uniref:Uncharacterized protein n=2 Tax=Triticum aestivum TaxID=4565 RepID=A0A9R1DJY8_WHEAT|nr:uncharacterized protein LOC109741522 [Aegilops tauschii subsp. strangulata]KAF6993174.1 hypothetical protein CFC21_010100 [Triticum aestivum]